MRKIILLALACLIGVSISSCGRFDRWTAGITGKATEVCHRGVTYVQFTSGATVAIDRQGKPIPCTN